MPRETSERVRALTFFLWDMRYIASVGYMRGVYLDTALEYAGVRKKPAVRRAKSHLQGYGGEIFPRKEVVFLLELHHTRGERCLSSSELVIHADSGGNLMIVTRRAPGYPSKMSDTGALRAG